MSRRLANARRIEALDPRADHQEIYAISTGYEFPWDYRRALELALLRTFALPSIARLLVSTREFAAAGQRRYDDTAILMGELAAHGYDSPRGRAALRRINRSHHPYPIDNDAMLYVLSTFVFDPVRWIDAYGWRPLLANEKYAAYHFYREVGTRMGITDVPDSYDEFAAFNRDVEQRLHPTPDSRELSDDVLGLVASWFPRPLRGAARRLVPATFDDGLRAGLGLPDPPGWQRRLAARGLRARASVVRRLPPRRSSAFDRAAEMFRSYPDGYDLDRVGAPHTSEGAPSRHTP